MVREQMPESASQNLKIRQYFIWYNIVSASHLERIGSTASIPDGVVVASCRSPSVAGFGERASVMGAYQCKE
jgi:hypothetical protein